MKNKDVHRKYFVVSGLLILYILVLVIFSWLNNKESRSELYEKSYRQIQDYEKNPLQKIFVSHEMCIYAQEKGFDCSWDTDIPYYYSFSLYDDATDLWYVFLQTAGSETTKRISTESVRITKDKNLNDDYVMYIDTEKAKKLHPRTSFIANRPYFYIPLEIK
jgi:uncharacterized protein YjiS (DUF1127 family)